MDLKFHCIDATSIDNDLSTELLEEACKKRKIPFIKYKRTEQNFLEAPKLGENDLFYRVGVGKPNSTLEGHMLTPEATSFYKPFRFVNETVMRYSDSYLLHQRAGVPIPKTVDIFTKDRKILKKYVEYVGGFPLIVKVIGGSHGVGVMKIDSFSSLSGVLDVVSGYSDQIIMRQFVKSRSHARLIVLGDKVIDSIKYTAVGDEFRTNVGDDLIVEPFKFDREILESAVRGVKVLGLEFGGVDIIIDDQSGEHYLLEVNFPAYFPRAQNITGNDIAGQMVDFLVAKSKKIG